MDMEIGRAGVDHPQKGGPMDELDGAQMNDRIAVLDAPSNLGLMPPTPGMEPGVRRLPETLRERSLVSRIGAIDAGGVAAPAYHPAVDPRYGVRNITAIASYSHELADRLEVLIRSDLFPLVLGGDCSILLGPLLALRRMGRFGLCFIDGHLDLLTPKTSSSNGAAGMDLALALGFGPALLSNLDKLRPLVRADDTVAMGYRGDLEGYGALTDPISRPNLLWVPLEQVRAIGAQNAVHSGLARLEGPGVEGFWIHLDVDVLDDQVMPAVDSRQPDGLSYAELGNALRALLNSRLAVGMDITILDPDLDPDGTVVERFTTFLEELFAERGAFRKPAVDRA
jgi:arginase